MKARHSAGFTLIELMVVVTLIAIASGLMTLALRDPAGTQLENEAARLVALLESARAESRASGISVRWEPHSAEANANANANTTADADEGFRFVGVTNTADFPSHWLGSGVSAEIVGARAVLLGPEPMIAPQRIILRLEDQRLALATDGLGPFAVVDSDTTPKP